MRSILAGFLLLACSATAAAADEGLARAMAALEDRWAHAKYEMTDKAPRLDAVRALHRETEALAGRYPGRAEPLIWRAVIFILEAEAHSNTASLGALRQARHLLDEAVSIDPAAMDGAAHANLGSLYYEVPGWPISFGDNRKAAAHLEAALAADPDGRDANYFYGDFLLQRGRARAALPYLEKALRVPVRPDHARADGGRRREVEEAYIKAKARLDS